MTLDSEERVSQKILFTLENSIFIFNALRGLPETYQKTIFVKSNDNLLFGRTKGERELFVSKSLRIIFPLSVSYSFNFTPTSPSQALIGLLATN